MHGFPPVLAGPDPDYGTRRSAVTVDECVILTPKECIRGNPVWWSYYATTGTYTGADYCLTVKKAGFNVYVLPMDGYHASIAENSNSHGNYYLTLRKVIKKHKNEHKWIYATTGSWSTRIPLNVQIFFQKTYYRLGLG